MGILICVLGIMYRGTYVIMCKYVYLCVVGFLCARARLLCCVRELLVCVDVCVGVFAWKCA